MNTTTNPTVNFAGTLFVVSAPSGAGKTTLVHRLVESDPLLRLSVSYTTRAPRPGEQNGVHYHFVSPAQFRTMVENGAFLEWAEVHGNCYGTARAWVEAELAAGRDVLLEIDWQGARQIKARFPACVTIFILPPSFAELEARLRKRASDSDTVIAKRLANAHEELRHVHEFEYVIINDRLDVATQELIAVVTAERCRTAKQAARHRKLFSEIAALSPTH
ncbi:guanylate kinase [Hydrogenophilus thermoluteolus]|nr:guanylate kinase [Hydrogenophilus thermoluteolus]MBW7656148.1 guanylate kinase [Hydrogenophilus thermoluteolus]